MRVLHKGACLARAFPYCFALALALSAFSPHLFAATSTIKTIEDAYVQNGSNANKNFGTAAELRIRTSSTAANNLDSYLRFNATSVSGVVSSAKLRINAKLSASGTVSTSVFAVANTTWAFNTITWNNKPARGASLGSVTVNSTSYSFKEIDVTNYVKSEFAAGRKVLSFAYHNAANSSPYITAPSINASSNQPELVITTSVANVPPTVSLTSPVNGATFTAPATISLSANAADADGSIAKVEYFNGATLIATGTAAPAYSASWSNVAAGSYSLTARATDNLGAASTSSAVSVSVTLADTQGPVISAQAPAPQAVLAANAIPTISASYSDAGSGVKTSTAKLIIDGVDVTANATITATGISYTPPQALAEGAHNVQLSIADNSGNLTQSTWAFTTRTPPQIQNISPANLQLIIDPLTAISASLSDIGAGVDSSRTTLTVDGAAISAFQSSATSLSYTPTANWSAGSHSVNVTIFDLAGNSTSSAWSFSYDPAPEIYDETPRDVFVAVPNPLIRVLLRDLGNGINLASTTIYLDGTNVSAQASITATEIRYTPTALSDGLHTVTVQTQSNTGKIATKQWQFTRLIPPAPPAAEEGVRTPPVMNTTIRIIP